MRVISGKYKGKKLNEAYEDLKIKITPNRENNEINNTSNGSEKKDNSFYRTAIQDCFEQFFRNCEKENVEVEKYGTEGKIFYNKNKIKLIKISKVSDFSENLKEKITKGKKLFYRGQSNINFYPIPGLFRYKEFMNNEPILFKELERRCPDVFENDSTVFEKLVRMQHFGGVTRLLDFTENYNVALYFACETNNKDVGEVLICSDEKIKYYDDELVEEIANISIKKTKANGNSCFVYPKLANRRVENQQGLFLFFGNESKEEAVEEFKKRTVKIKDENGEKQLVFYIPSAYKNKILEELKTNNIQQGFLFPDIENIAKSIKTEILGEDL